MDFYGYLLAAFGAGIGVTWLVIRYLQSRKGEEL